MTIFKRTIPKRSLFFVAGLILCAVAAFIVKQYQSSKMSDISTPQVRVIELGEEKMWGPEETYVMPPTMTPTPTLDPDLPNQLIAAIDFEDPQVWLYFNQDFSNQSRSFRFKYPSAFEIEDIDSADVVLRKDGIDYLAIESIIPLIVFPGNSNDDKFIYAYYYQMRNRTYDEPPALEFERIELDGNRFFYKVVEETKDWTKYRVTPYSTTRNLYMGVVHGKGILMVELIPLPTNAMRSLMQSIEFKVTK